MHVYSCHIQSQLVTRAARSGNFKNYSPHGCARLIERPGKLPVLSTRLIVRRVFSHQRVHVFPPFSPFTPISLFFSPLVYSRPVTGICISLIPPAFQHLHARSSSIDSHRLAIV